MTTQPREVRVTAEKCMDYGMQAMGRQADQATAQYDPLGGLAGGEACANCLFFMSPNGCTVVQDWPSPISPTGHSKFWTAIPSMEEMPPMRVVIVEEEGNDEGMSMGEMGLKAVWSTAMVNDFPDSSFAVILPGGEKDESGKMTPRSLRKLPYKDASGKVDAAHLRNALSRLPQTDLTASQRASAQRKLDAAAKAEGIGQDGKSLLDRIVAAVKSAFTTTEAAPAGPEGQQHHQGAGLRLAPPDGAFRVYKSVEGEYRWVALVSNKYRDRDNKENGPEIIEEAAHKEYVSYLDNGGDYPEAWLWHTPGTRWGKADWADYADGFLLMSGTVDKDMEGVAAALEGESLGVSHGFYQRYSDASKGIIGWYRTFEVSALPPEAAANPWTALSVIQKEVGMAIDPRKRGFLESKLGKERVAALEGDVTALGKALQEAGVEYKDLLEAGTDTPSLSAKDIADAITKAMEPTTAAVQALTATATETKQVAETTATGLLSLAERVKALERSDDEKIATALTAKSAEARNGGGYRASEKNGVTPEDDDLKDAKPSLPQNQKDWLTQALGPIVGG